MFRAVSMGSKNDSARGNTVAQELCEQVRWTSSPLSSTLQCGEVHTYK